MENLIEMSEGVPVWIWVGLIIVVSLISPLALLFSIMRKRGKHLSEQRWILKNGRPGKARITAVRDTRARDGRDYFILEISVEVIEPRSVQPLRTVRTAVSPLDFHRLDAGQELAIRLHPESGEVALDLPASNA